MMTKFEAIKSDKQRRRTRINAHLPISINGVQGVTRDISTSGLFVVQSRQHEMGSRIDFCVDLDTPGGKLKLCCEGEVVRVEEVDGRVGIGVKILSQVISSSPTFLRAERAVRARKPVPNRCLSRP
jgi:hypothetical protein